MRFFRWFGPALVLVMLLGAGVVLWTIETIESAGPLTEPRIIVIDRGTGLAEIARQLEAEGVARSAWLVIAAAKLDGSGRALRAGEYLFPAGVSVSGAIDLLQSGRTHVRTLTVPEGLTVPRILALLDAETALTGKVQEAPAEGSLLPDTYHFTRGDSRENLLARMRAAMDGFLAEAWRARDPAVPLASPAEAVVLASIIEKETGIPEERAKVAGVFVNRIKAGMRLQSDPTVVYALSDGTGQLGRPLTRADWQVASPFNTYQIDGLPPAPIANPGKDAIRAALNPEQHRFFYFVADGSGGHAFAATLEDHNRNVAAWRRVRRQSTDQP